MNTRIATTRKIALTVAAAAVAVGYVASAAEPVTEVIVEAPRIVHSAQKSGALGAPIDIASVKYRVSYADLDLATRSGATTLEQRINDAAKRACKQLDSAVVPGTPMIESDPPCAKSAAEAAMKQARVAIAAAEKKAGK